jgi:hypothetical protein
MYWFELLIALLISVSVAVLFVPLLGWRRPGGDEGALMAFLFFFFLIFLAALAGGMWIRPVGPTAWGVSWLGYLMVALVVALLLAAVSPPKPRRERGLGGSRTAGGEATMPAGLGTFFWILMLLLLFVTAAAYAVDPDAWRLSEPTIYQPAVP